MRVIGVRRAVAAVEQPTAVATHLRRVDRAHAPHLLGDDEVGPRLLLRAARSPSARPRRGSWSPTIASADERRVRVARQAVEITARAPTAGRTRRDTPPPARAGSRRATRNACSSTSLRLDRRRRRRARGRNRPARTSAALRRPARGTARARRVRGRRHRARAVEDLTDQLDAGRGQSSSISDARKEAGRLADRETRASRRCASSSRRDEVAVLSPRSTTR